MDKEKGMGSHIFCAFLSPNIDGSHGCYTCIAKDPIGGRWRKISYKKP